MKFIVVEKRMIVVEYEIEAESQADAEQLNGDIISEHESDNYAYELVSCKEVEEF